MILCLPLPSMARWRESHCLLVGNVRVPSCQISIVVLQFKLFRKLWRSDISVLSCFDRLCCCSSSRVHGTFILFLWCLCEILDWTTGWGFKQFAVVVLRPLFTVVLVEYGNDCLCIFLLTRPLWFFDSNPNVLALPHDFVYSFEDIALFIFEAMNAPQFRSHLFVCWFKISQPTLSLRAVVDFA